jgi:hypothetical protein
MITPILRVRMGRISNILCLLFIIFKLQGNLVDFFILKLLYVPVHFVKGASTIGTSL